jgi:hypothetical protein
MKAPLRFVARIRRGYPDTMRSAAGRPPYPRLVAWLGEGLFIWGRWYYKLGCLP